MKTPSPPHISDISEAEDLPPEKKQPKQRKSVSTQRSMFWPGFSLSLLLLGILSCGGLSMLLNINPIRLAQIRGQQVSWEPSEPIPDVLSENDIQVQGAEFQIGQRVQNLTNSRVNIRRSPGYLGKSDDDILFQVVPEAEMEILAAPESVDGLQWWHILYVANPETVIEGWVAEATASGVQILGN